MANILLTGAGFTRNRGGWLAREVRSKIAQRVEDDPYLRDVLNKADGSESALEFVQNEYATSRNSVFASERLRAFQNAIASTFDAMNSGLARRDFEFCNDMAFSVSSYLTRFNAFLHSEPRPPDGATLPSGIQYSDPIAGKSARRHYPRNGAAAQSKRLR